MEATWLDAEPNDEQRLFSFYSSSSSLCGLAAHNLDHLYLLAQPPCYHVTHSFHCIAALVDGITREGRSLDPHAT